MVRIQSTQPPIATQTPDPSTVIGAGTLPGGETFVTLTGGRTVRFPRGSGPFGGSGFTDRRRQTQFRPTSISQREIGRQRVEELAGSLQERIIKGLDRFTGRKERLSAKRELVRIEQQSRNLEKKISSFDSQANKLNQQANSLNKKIEGFNNSVRKGELTEQQFLSRQAQLNKEVASLTKRSQELEARQGVLNTEISQFNVNLEKAPKLREQAVAPPSIFKPREGFGLTQAERISSREGFLKAEKFVSEKIVTPVISKLGESRRRKASFDITQQIEKGFTPSQVPSIFLPTKDRKVTFTPSESAKFRKTVAEEIRFVQKRPITSASLLFGPTAISKLGRPAFKGVSRVTTPTKTPPRATIKEIFPKRITVTGKIDAPIPRARQEALSGFFKSQPGGRGLGRRKALEEIKLKRAQSIAEEERLIKKAAEIERARIAKIADEEKLLQDAADARVLRDEKAPSFGLGRTRALKEIQLKKAARLEDVQKKALKKFTSERVQPGFVLLRKEKGIKVFAQREKVKTEVGKFLRKKPPTKPIKRVNGGQQLLLDKPVTKQKPVRVIRIVEAKPKPPVLKERTSEIIITSKRPQITRAIQVKPKLKRKGKQITVQRQRNFFDETVKAKPAQRQRQQLKQVARETQTTQQAFARSLGRFSLGSLANLGQLSKEVTAERQRFRERTREKETFGELGRPRLRERTTFKGGVRFKELGRLKELERLKTRTTTTKVPPTTLIPRLKIGSALRTNRIAKGVKKPAYDTFVKRRGKYRKIADDLPRGKALRAGAQRARNTLAASFKIRRDGFTKKADVPFRPNPGVFRDFKIVKGRRVPLQDEYIQRRKKRLSRRPEVSEIQLSKRFAGGFLR